MRQTSQIAQGHVAQDKSRVPSRGEAKKAPTCEKLVIPVAMGLLTVVIPKKGSATGGSQATKKPDPSKLCIVSVHVSAAGSALHDHNLLISAQLLEPSPALVGTIERKYPLLQSQTQLYDTYIHSGLMLSLIFFFLMVTT